MNASPSRPELTVVVVAWKAREDVLRLLASLDDHAGLSFEVVVVDDGSDDGTSEVVRREWPRHTVVSKVRNEGLVAGRNAALPHIRGRIVAMLDADTIVRPGALPALVSHLDRHPRVGLVGPKLVHLDGRLQLSARRWTPFVLPFLRRGPYARLNPSPAMHERHLMMDDDHTRTRPVVWVAGAAQVYRADLIPRLGEYDRRISSYGGEDLDWCLRVWKAGLEVWYAPDAEIVHVFQQMTRRKPFGRKSWRALRDHVYIQVKHRQLRRSPLLRAANA